MSIESFIIDTELAGDSRHATCYVVRDLECARTLLHEWLIPRRDQWIGCDAETNAIDPWHAGYRLRALQFADEREAWVLDVQRLGPHVVRRLMRSHHNLVAHFSENDLRFIERGAPGSIDLGSLVPHLYDNQVALAYYDPRTVMTESSKPGIDPRLVRPKGLKPTSTREFPSILDPKRRSVLERIEGEFDAWARAHAPKGHRTGDNLKAWKFGHVPFDEPIYQAYSAMDPLYTIRLWHKMLAVIHERGQWPIVKSDLELQWDIDQTTFRGLPVDEKYARWLDGKLWQRVCENDKILSRYNIGSAATGPNIAAAFMSMGVESPKTTPAGAPSFDKTVIPDLIKWNGPVGELARAVKANRQAVKFRSTYIEPMITALTAGDGRVHCSMRAIGTTTGRMSAARPPLQQMPKKSTIVRSAFGSVPGWVFVSCDMSQGEPRTMAARSGDPNLKRDLASGDINGRVAEIAFGDAYVPSEGKTAGTASYLMRNAGKTAFLAGCYGAGDGKVDDSAGVERGTGLMARWRDEYRVAFARGAVMNGQPWVVLDSGRVCYLWDRYTIDENDNLRLTARPSRLALNYDTQGSQRDILARAWAALRAAGWAAYLALFVHDEIILHVPEHMAEAARAALQAAMTIELDNGVTMECEATIDGSTWLPQPAAFTDDDIDFDMAA